MNAQHNFISNPDTFLIDVINAARVQAALPIHAIKTEWPDYLFQTQGS